MRITRWLVIALMLAAPPSFAQSECEALTESDWLREPTASDEAPMIDSSRVFVAIRDVPTTIARLQKRGFIALSQRDATRFAGADATPPVTDRPVWPYLVRAVFPARGAKLEVGWSGNDLHVFATGSGCEPYVKQPIIVFLERRPARVFVLATRVL